MTNGTIAYNLETRRVGCILMQRMMGTTATAEDIAGLTWEANSMDGMKVYPFDADVKAHLEAIEHAGAER